MVTVIKMRPELFKALIEPFKVNNPAALMRETEKCEAKKQIGESFTNADPTLIIFHEPKAMDKHDGK